MNDEPECSIERPLDSALNVMWAKRKEIEALLDLGERKNWSANDRASAVREAAMWLERTLALTLPQPTASTEIATGSRGFAEVRAWAENQTRDSTGGAAQWIQFVASATGVSAKTLANQLSVRSKDQAYSSTALRWLSTIEAALSERLDAEAVWFHRRTPQSISRQIARWSESKFCTSADALLIVSMLALWQRRRDTRTVRANRGTARSRKETPLPCGVVGAALVSEGQFCALVKLANAMRDEPREQLFAVAFEAALTAAHFGPHPVRVRRSGAADAGVVGPSLDVVESTRKRTALNDTDKDVVSFRIELMRAYDADQPLRNTSTAPGEYARAAAAINRIRYGESLESEPRFSATAPGIVMIVNQLRRLGLVE